MKKFFSSKKNLLPAVLAASVIIFCASFVYFAGDVQLVSSVPLSKQQKLQQQQTQIQSMLHKMKADAKRIRESALNTPGYNKINEPAKADTPAKTKTDGDSQ
ncbi:hypothetical protein ACOI22_00565 [Glaciecola sp. 2405UD65-10]|uniref:hypothetical protein n=1 Tax=Glaciecola sp. 2405UD65-10 TaxID=3397244 RepID=UPI003B5AE376